MKYIDAEKLKAEIQRYKNKADERLKIKGRTFGEEQKDLALQNLCGNLLYFISSLQQDETQVDKMLCSQILWEEQGWIMIPPDATIEGIDSLLRQVKKKLQQEQPGLPGIKESGIPGKDYIPVEWVDACEMYGKWKIVKQEQPEVDLEKEIEEHTVYMPHGEFASDNEVIEDMEWARKEFRYFYELGLNERVEQEQPNNSFCEENCKGYRDTGGKCFFDFNCSAKKSQERPEVDLEMVVGIDNIVMTMLGEGYNDGYKTRPFYEEVLKRFNEQRNESES